MISRIKISIVALALLSIGGCNISPSIKALTKSHDASGKSVELGEFIKLFMIDYRNKEESPSWSIGTQDALIPITWVTSGLDNKETRYAYSDANENRLVYFRHARAKAMVDGRIIYGLTQRPVPLEWDINLSSYNYRMPEFVTFTPDQNCFEPGASGCVFDVEKALKASGLEYQFMCYLSGWGNLNLRKISYPGKASAYLSEEEDCGTGGCRTYLSLDYELPKYKLDYMLVKSAENCRAITKSPVDYEKCISEHVKISSRECR